MHEDKRGREGITAPAFLTRVILTVAAFGFTGCSITPGQDDGRDAFCMVDAIEIHADFDGAAVHACSAGALGPVLTIAPEYAPINPSPWYAYRLDSNQARQVTITHRYRYARHRYQPWVDRGHGWELLPAEAVTIDEQGNALIQIDLAAGTTMVAAQPLLGDANMRAWAGDLASKRDLARRAVAVTPEGRAVELYESHPPAARSLVLLLGRQHPPEVTGALAYRDFVDRLFENDAAARQFRERFRIALVPLINPDGVAGGHWRVNARGVDLNRDWGPFTQPETRGVGNWLEQAVENTPLVLMLDFHSTWHDVLYAQHHAARPLPPGFDQAWRQALEARLGTDAPQWSDQHNAGLPTAKTWAHARFGVTAITYEVGDQTPPEIIKINARIAAEEMMRLLLELESPDP